MADAATDRVGSRTLAGGWARRIALVGVGALVAFVAACGIHIGSFELRFGFVDESLDSGIGVASTAVARSPGEWARLWLAHDARFLPSRPLPFVDFNREIVVAVFLGHRSDRCRQVRIERVLMIDDSRIVVRYREIFGPPFPGVGPSCQVGQSFPAAIARIPAFNLPVRFEPMPAVFMGRESSTRSVQDVLDLAGFERDGVRPGAEAAFLVHSVDP